MGKRLLVALDQRYPNLPTQGIDYNAMAQEFDTTPITVRRVIRDIIERRGNLERRKLHGVVS